MRFFMAGGAEDDGGMKVSRLQLLRLLLLEGAGMTFRRLCLWVLRTQFWRKPTYEFVGLLPNSTETYVAR